MVPEAMTHCGAEIATDLAHVSKRRSPALLNDLDQFLAELCTEWGFCGRLAPADLLAEGERLNADEFAKAVLLAEGINPEHEKQWQRAIKRRFVERYGDSITGEQHASRN